MKHSLKVLPCLLLLFAIKPLSAATQNVKADCMPDGKPAYEWVYEQNLDVNKNFWRYVDSLDDPAAKGFLQHFNKVPNIKAEQLSSAALLVAALKHYDSKLDVNFSTLKDSTTWVLDENNPRSFAANIVAAYGLGYVKDNVAFVKLDAANAKNIEIVQKTLTANLGVPLVRLNGAESFWNSVKLSPESVSYSPNVSTIVALVTGYDKDKLKIVGLKSDDEIFNAEVPLNKLNGPFAEYWLVLNKNKMKDVKKPLDSDSDDDSNSSSDKGVKSKGLKKSADSSDSGSDDDSDGDTDSSAASHKESPACALKNFAAEALENVSKEAGKWSKELKCKGKKHK